MSNNLQKGFIFAIDENFFINFVFFAKKSDKNWRFCIDYHQFNNFIEIDFYFLSLINEIIDKLQNVIVFIKIDIKQTFNKIRIYPDFIDVTTFKIRFDIYKYNILSFNFYNDSIIFNVILTKYFSIF